MEIFGLRRKKKGVMHRFTINTVTQRNKNANRRVGIFISRALQLRSLMN